MLDLEHALALGRAIVDGDAVAARAELARLEVSLVRALPDWRAAEALSLLYEGCDQAGAEAVLSGALEHNDGDARVSLLIARARSRYLYGRFGDASLDAEAAVAAGGIHATRALLMASVTDRETGRLERARTRAQAVQAQAADTVVAVWGRLHEASAEAMLGHVSAAEVGYRAVLAQAPRLGMRRAVALATCNLGYCASRAGDQDAALSWFRRASVLFDAIGDAFMVNKLEVRAARAALDRGDLAVAADRAQRASEVAVRHDDQDVVLHSAILKARIELERALASARAQGFVTVTQAIEGPVQQLRPAPPLAPMMRIDRGGYWFEPPRKTRVELGSRASLRRVLAHLLERRLVDPDAAASTAELASAGWPSERILPEAAQDRVYTAVGTLRKMGLEGLLVRRDGGYALDPSVPVQVAAS